MTTLSSLITSTSAIAMVATLCIGGCQNNPSPQPQLASGKSMTELPLCTNAIDLTRLDGQVVRLSGIYRKFLIQGKTMPAMGPNAKPETPEHFLGHGAVEINGAPIEYDPQASAEGIALVRLGLTPRPDGEAERYHGKPVTVIGRLIVNGSQSDDDEEDIARPDPLPMLSEIKQVIP